MLNKSLLCLIATTLLLSACSTTKEIVVEPVDKPKLKIEKSEEILEEVKIQTFNNCNECSTPLELMEFFDSIDYETASKDGTLILSQITKNLFVTKDIQLKKEAFFKSIYPLAYQVNKEIKAERLDLDQGKHITKLMKKYKVNSVADLKIRLNTIPIPIIMAQAAIESAYGTSRFAKEGNALFGQWTRDPNGITPREKPDSKWKVAKFNTPLDSTRAYALNINSNKSYFKLRIMRSKGKDPVYGLDKYSQKGKEYIGLVQSVIRINNLEQYK